MYLKYLGKNRVKVVKWVNFDSKSKDTKKDTKISHNMLVVLTVKLDKQSNR